jgi:hypothetical protein
MAEWVANSEQALQKMLGDMRELWRQHKYLKVKATVGTKRSREQNSFSHAWYTQMALEDRQFDITGHKCYCKLHHGVPIMRAEDPDFRSAYDGVLRSLSYEQKLEAMKFWPVTSLMTKDQLSRYFAAVQEDYRKRGVILEFPQGE